jgi:putative Holliday junction resolvase
LRVLGLDFGQKRMGVALSDTEGILASPLTTVTCETDSERINAVLDLVAGNDVRAIVVGAPISLSGRKGPQAGLVTRFVQGLAARVAVPVTTIDERYTTVEAERLLREAGRHPSRDRARVDAVAAALILQSYLDAGRAGR